MFFSFFLACWSTADDIHEVHTTSSPTAYRTEGTDVVIVVLDTLRADHLTQYGHERDTSPGLGTFASVATRFDSAWAPASWTLPSTTTILTGQHPLRHGMRHPGDILPAATVTLAEGLRDAGWHTGGFSHNVSVAPRHGMNQGFDHFTINTGKVLGYPHARKLVVAAQSWLDDQARGPTLLFLQPMNCHGPYKFPESKSTALLGREPSGGFQYYEGLMGKILSDRDMTQRKAVKPRYVASAREQYDTAVRYETDEVGRLFEELKQRGRFEDALIILTADHGEEFFEHGGFSHGYSLFSEVLRVPLWVKMPGQRAPGVVTAPVSLADIVPTVLEGVGLPPGSATLDGHSLIPLLKGETRPATPLVFEVDWQKRFVGAAILSEGWKLVRIDQNYEGLHDTNRLFDTTADPGEKDNVAKKHPKRVQSLSTLLDTRIRELSSGIVPESRITDDDKKQLEALGYLE